LEYLGLSVLDEASPECAKGGNLPSRRSRVSLTRGDAATPEVRTSKRGTSPILIPVEASTMMPMKGFETSWRP
jgi:hypothetical protein